MQVYMFLFFASIIGQIKQSFDLTFFAKLSNVGIPIISILFAIIIYLTSIILLKVFNNNAKNTKKNQYF